MQEAIYGEEDYQRVLLADLLDRCTKKLIQNKPEKNMSTEQTDAHNERQEGIYQNFCQHIEEHGIASAKMELRSLVHAVDVDPETLKKCEERLKKAEMDEGDPNDEFREHQEREAEAHAQRMDEHFAPSEGPDRL